MNLEVDASLRRFIANAIQFQFLQHGIKPTVHSSDYLDREPSMNEVDALLKPNNQDMAVHNLPLWRIESLYG
jgi:hypothetical protein